MSRRTDVDRGEDREDVGLQEADQDLEHGHEHEHDERQHAEYSEDDVVALEDELLGEQRERHEQDVAGQHVGEETNGEREGADDQVREDLDGADQRVEGRRDARRGDHVAEVAEPLVLQAGSDVHEPDEQGEEQRDRHSSRCRHVQDRDDARQVAQIDENEQRQQERGPAHARLAHRRHDDLVLDELDEQLREVADALGRLGTVLAGSDQEDHDADQRRGDGDERDLVEGREQVAPTEDFVQGREFEASTLFPICSL